MLKIIRRWASHVAELLRRQLLGKQLIERCASGWSFAGTPSRVDGIAWISSLKKRCAGHKQASTTRPSTHDWIPGRIPVPRAGRASQLESDDDREVQHATRGDSYSTFKEFSALANFMRIVRHRHSAVCMDFVERRSIALDECRARSAISGDLYRGDVVRITRKGRTRRSRSR